MRKLCLFLFLISALFSYAQLTENDTVDTIPISNGLPGGINAFRQEVTKKVDLSGFSWTNSFTVVLSFVVSKEGKINDIQIIDTSGNKELDRRLINAVKSMKKKWNPAMLDGQPVDYRFRLPFKFLPMK